MKGKREGGRAIFGVDIENTESVRELPVNRTGKRCPESKRAVGEVLKHGSSFSES